MQVRRIAWQFIFFAISTNAAFSGARAATEFLHLVNPKVHRRYETALRRSTFPERTRLDYPYRLGLSANTSAKRSWRNVFGMNTSGIRDVEWKIKELSQLQACASDSFDPFNFFNIDTFDTRRSSPENSATYSSARLARALPLSDA